MLQLNIPQKLGTPALIYLLIYSLVGVLILSFFLSLFDILTFSDAGFLLLLVVLVAAAWVYVFLWWKLFEYRVDRDHIMIRSGVIIRRAKTVNFNDVQSTNSVIGPLLGLLSLRRVRGFTSSPEQITISSSGSGTHTRHRPDIDLILDKNTAEEVINLMQKGDVQKVQSVS